MNAVAGDLARLAIGYFFRAMNACACSSIFSAC
jgi:hypothetical protein